MLPLSMVACISALNSYVGEFHAITIFIQHQSFRCRGREPHVRRHLDAALPQDYTVWRQHRIAAPREGVSGVWSVVKFAVRAATWRSTLSPLAGLATLIGCTLALAIAAPAFTRDPPRVPGAVYAERKDSKAPTSRGGAQGESAQSALLRAAVTRLAPQRRGTTDIYAVGIAGWTSLR